MHIIYHGAGSSAEKLPACPAWSVAEGCDLLGHPGCCPAPGAALQVPDIMGRAVLKPWVFRRDILREGRFLGLWVAGSQFIHHSHAAISWVVPGGWAGSRALERA